MSAEVQAKRSRPGWLWVVLVALAILVGGLITTLSLRRTSGLVGEKTGVVLVLGRHDAFVLIDVDNGRQRTIGGLSLAPMNGTPAAQRVGDELVFLEGGSPEKRTAFAVALSEEADFSRRRRLGVAQGLLPSDTPNRVWLADDVSGILGRSADDLASVREVDLSGRQTRMATAPSYAAIFAVADGDLVLDAATDDGKKIGPCRSEGCRHRLWLWDPNPGGPLSTFGSTNPTLIAHGGAYIVWNELDAGKGQRLAHLFDVRSRTERVSGPEGVVQVCCGEISPDGRTLAAFAFTRTDRGAIFLIDTRTGRSRSLRGSEEASLPPTWSKSGKWLFFGVGRNRSGAPTGVGAYRMGSDADTIIDVDIRAGFQTLVAS